MKTAMCVDHVIVPTKDIDRLEKVYRSLGFSLSPRKTYPFGDAEVDNHLLYMNGCYIEFAAVTSGRVDLVNDILDKREGPAALAFRCDDPESIRARARDVGFDVQCTDFDVDFTVDGRNYQGTFRASVFVHESYPVSWVQTIEETIPYDRSPFFQPHANTTQGLKKVVLVAAAPSQVAYLYDLIVGHPYTEQSLPLQWKDSIIDYAVLSPELYVSTYGDIAETDREKQPCICALHFGIQDMVVARSILIAANIPFWDRDGQLVISSDVTGGTTIVLEAVA